MTDPIQKVLDDSAAAQAAFVEDMTDLDAAFASGTVKDWIGDAYRQLAGERSSETVSDSGGG